MLALEYSIHPTFLFVSIYKFSLKASIKFHLAGKWLYSNIHFQWNIEMNFLRIFLYWEFFPRPQSSIRCMLCKKLITYIVWCCKKIFYSSLKIPSVLKLLSLNINLKCLNNIVQLYKENIPLKRKIVDCTTLIDKKFFVYFKIKKTFCLFEFLLLIIILQNNFKFFRIMFNVFLNVIYEIY